MSKWKYCDSAENKFFIAFVLRAKSKNKELNFTGSQKHLFMEAEMSDTGKRKNISRMTVGVGVGGEGLSKKEKGLMDMGNSVVIAGGRALQGG